MKVGDLIPIGGSGNVKKNEVLSGKTYSSDEGTDLVGTMRNNGRLIRTLTNEGDQFNIPAGYTSGGNVKAQITNLIADNIKADIVVGGIKGKLDIGKLLSSENFTGILATSYDNWTAKSDSLTCDTDIFDIWHNDYGYNSYTLFVIQTLDKGSNISTVIGKVTFDWDKYKDIEGSDIEIIYNTWGGDFSIKIEHFSDMFRVYPEWFVNLKKQGILFAIGHK